MKILSKYVHCQSVICSGIYKIHARVIISGLGISVSNSLMTLAKVGPNGEPIETPLCGKTVLVHEPSFLKILFVGVVKIVATSKNLTTCTVCPNKPYKHDVFARLVTSCQQIWNKLLTTFDNLVGIFKLVTNLFQKCVKIKT